MQRTLAVLAAAVLLFPCAPIHAAGRFFATDAITDHALDFLAAARQARAPWFLYVAYQAPHFPDLRRCGRRDVSAATRLPGDPAAGRPQPAARLARQSSATADALLGA